MLNKYEFSTIYEGSPDEGSEALQTAYDQGSPDE